MQAIYESAEDAVFSIDELTSLHNRNVAVIEVMGRSSKNTMRVFEYMEANPIIEIKKTAEVLNLTFNTVSGTVKRMMDAGILLQTDGNSRNRVFSYEAYLEILRKGT